MSARPALPCRWPTSCTAACKLHRCGPVARGEGWCDVCGCGIAGWAGWWQGTWLAEPGVPCRPATILASCLRHLQDCKAKTPAPGKLKEFQQYLHGEGAARQDVQQLRAEVRALASSFEMPGGDW